jgi:hypothetical protein
MTFYPSFTIHSDWWDDGLSPPEIGNRFLRMLHLLGPLAPAMSNWLISNGSDPESVLPVEAGPAMTALVECNVWDESGEPEPESGYHLYAKGSAAPSDYGAADSINISVTAGSQRLNSAEFHVGDIRYPNDLSLTTYPIYKGAIEALASAWPCPWALAYEYTGRVPPVDRPASSELQLRPPFEVAWIAYLSAPLAIGLAPPSEIASERTPGGGMILSAIETRIDQSDLNHMRRSRMLEAIMIERVGVAKPPLFGAVKYPARIGSY